MTFSDFVQPGDVLLYRPSGVFGWLIALKTWHAIAHCEAYAGRGYAVASRDGVGVGRYPVRREGLVRILRPVPAVDMDAAMAWFATVDGQKYDWLGLIRFATWRAQHPRDRMFCSAFLTRWLRAGHAEPFQPDEDADSIAPFEFQMVKEWKDYIVNDGLVTPAHIVQEAA